MGPKVVIFLLFVMVAVTVVSAQRGCQSGGCICTANYLPVCGSNGRTYSNRCMLQCDQQCNPGLRLAHPGACRGGRGGSPRQPSIYY